MSKKSKVLHIVKDYIWFKNIFEIFENTFKGQNSYYIFRNRRRNIHLSYITNLNYISKSIFSRLQMPSKMENYDFIMIYGLNDNFEMEIISKLIKPKIIWFVMGADIYEDKNIWKKKYLLRTNCQIIRKIRTQNRVFLNFLGQEKIDNWKYKLAMMRRIDFIANYRDNQFLFLKKLDF